MYGASIVSVRGRRQPAGLAARPTARAAGIASARLRAPADLAGHPQLLARDRWRTVGTPGGGIDALLPPVEMSGVVPVMGAVPALGEHTEAIRAEFRPGG